MYAMGKFCVLVTDCGLRGSLILSDVWIILGPIFRFEGRINLLLNLSEYMNFGSIISERG